MEQNPNYQQNPWQNQNIYGGQNDLPNATLVLVMGICSIVICAIGPILATIGLVLARQSRKTYNENPASWTDSSYKNLNTGRICSIIGLCTGLISWIAIIAYIIWWFMMISMINSQMQEAIHNMPQ